VLKTANVWSIECPTDFVPRHTDVTFSGLPSRDRYRIVIDPDNTVREIYEENNSADIVRE